MNNEIRNEIINNIDDYIDSQQTFDEVFNFMHATFCAKRFCNRDNNLKAQKSLKRFNKHNYHGTFGALSYICNWESSKFGKINIQHLINPEKAYDMICYILGRQILSNALKKVNLNLNSKMNYANVQDTKEILIDETNNTANTY